jgi:transposase
VDEPLKHAQPDPPPVQPRLTAAVPSAGTTWNSRRIAALPLLEPVLEKLHLEEFLRDHLPAEDSRSRIATSTTLMVLLKNILLAREPLYGVGEWARRYVPDGLGLSSEHVSALNDDRIGRSLDRLFDAAIPTLTLQVVAHAVRVFGVSLDELHNDSTTITFHGDYENAAEERTLRGQLRRAITWGHNKDHRPDLKQMLYILTVTRDGAVPVQFRVESGNATDDRSHRSTWDFLCQWTGRRDFLYVADCKLVTTENMAYVHQNGGRFVSVLPRTRGEDAAFRTLVRQGQARWQPLHDKVDEHQEVVDRFSIHEPERASAEGYRLIWYHSTRKAECDAHARHHRLERALKKLMELRDKLTSPRTRHRERAQVAQAVETILREGEVADWIEVTVVEQTEATYRQERRGRPGANTRYVKQERLRFDISIFVLHERLAAEALGDGIFPLITNDVKLSALELLLSYKQQPMIEKRFAQLKTDFVVAPVFLKEASRIQALLCVYFFALLVEALLERELRRAMERADLASLPLYPEGRPCRRPTARRVIDLFEDVQQHTLTTADQAPMVFTTELTRVQRKVLQLLGISKAYDF